jgi:cell fate regulator YaaT (PSP1 superfamily)
MIKVAGVRFRKAGKVYYFDPAGMQLEKDSKVIVETSRGQEFGLLAEEVKEVEESVITTPLKRIIRIADEKDEAQHNENMKKKSQALELCLEKIEKHKLEMKLIDVEYTFDNSKIIFYFTADGRVDFRELVKDLAGVFKMRIELRQIGVRDEAKLIGGIGTCGKPLCCYSWIPEFQPVSIKMAKVQNLSLNPTKISGICSRLMCCLKYENDVYCELRRGMPDVGEKVMTPEGIGVVSESNILENRIRVRHVLEEKDGEQQEKLSSDYSTYTKQQIKRLGSKKKQGAPQEEKDEDLPDEVRDLIRE